jgi:WD40 repeat protein
LQDEVCGISWSNDGRFLAAGSEDKIVSLVELVALLQKLRYGDDKAFSINLSDLKYIANNTSLRHIFC